VAEAAEAAREAVARTAYGGTPAAEAAARMAGLADAIERARPVRAARGGAMSIPLALAALTAGPAVAGGSTSASADLQADARQAWEAANGDYRAGDFEAAAVTYRALLSERRDPYLLADLAAAEWQSGRPAAAAARYLDALELAPREAGIRGDLERLRAELGDPPGLAAAADRVPPVRVDELLLVLLAASWLGAGAVVFAPVRRRRIAGAFVVASLALLAAGAGGTAVAVGGGPDAVAGAGAVLAGRPAGPAIARLPEGSALDVLERGDEAWRVRAPGLPAGWVASGNLVPLD
ncbi:MAG TPA: hypothetical protein VM778_03805, partial [Gemmatimonadota bacterium]|nr:hypothetical protein [Gemmatimonadota bacterium]